MTDVTTIESMLGDTIGQTIGDPTLVGIVGVALFILLVAFSGMDFTVGILIMVPLLILFAGAGILPYWIIYLVFLGVGVIAAMVVKKWLEGS